ncbi:histidinol-phosphatase [Paenibacillus radicis (ex Gao et al. 2016)]|uniref:Histidinol-phosphatase n=1 Tax=Paenibacillus radicis (ex Gao et al. 2016) TaxID=1737354 RepID=A0A917GWM7_9BACL|nr:histidinol-phosphatase [Paenibacillus radicis (ex Gao et al. 2016)]GGG58938.1 putative histidinol-phosphatase [Paenibacillus radicis (ex Gao et al. 2016)]
MKFDFHTHHERCGHASGSVRDYIEAARNNGLHMIGISDHTPFFAASEDRPSLTGSMAKSDFPGYIQEVLALKKEFAGSIEVLLGIEADFLPEHLDLYREVIASHPFDYVIGSVHDFAGIGIYDSEYWESLSPERKLETKNLFYDYIAQSAKSGLYDILGHVDSLNRYFYGYSELRTEAADRTLKTIADSDVVIEINSSDDNWVPDGYFLERAFHYGVKVTFGSDAHEPERVGEHFEAIGKQLYDIGYREWAVFRNRERFMVPIER